MDLLILGKSGHNIHVPAPTFDHEMPACYKNLEIVSSSPQGLSVMTSFMATKSSSPLPTKPSPVQERVSHAPIRIPPPFPARIYTREHEWTPESAQGIFSKFKQEFKDLHGASIGDVDFDLFKLSFTTWMQNSRK